MSSLYESVHRLLITGDLLFVGKVGGTQTDGDARTEWRSLQRLLTLVTGRGDGLAGTRLRRPAKLDDRPGEADQPVSPVRGRSGVPAAES